jgi:transposase-like protein
MSGTIFERSRTPLKNWFYAIFLMSATRSGISAKQLQRELGVTYKTAWRMFREIRTLMQSSPQPMLGIVEADECYIGGRSHGKRGRASENKTPVFGLVQRGGNVHSEKVERVTARNLKAIIRERVDRSSIMVTDEFWSYNYLHEEFAGHLRVNHSKGEYANGIVHTNTIEGFWSVLKRGINGVYHAVSKKYLQSYIDEYAFRYNHRKDEQPMFLTILAKV